VNALTVGSLFSGIGGLDLGLERAGMRVIWQSEIDPYASRVLKKHWPEVPNYGDIKTIDWRTVEPPDVICGGYPCQPFSTAGKRQGEQDSRHLWPWVRESLRILRPRYAVLENVQGHLSLGGPTVIREITELGYNCEWRIIPAASVGAPHRRNRLFIVAYADSEGLERGGGIQGRETQPLRSDVFSASTQWHKEWTGWEWWKSEPGMGRVAYGVPARVDRLKGIGNAVVPQVAEIVGRLVVEHSTR
jgi:DNA (cytosine-5)-methyltransferase 1